VADYDDNSGSSHALLSPHSRKARAISNIVLAKLVPNICQGKVCLCSNYSRQLSQAESIGLVRAILKRYGTTSNGLEMTRH
jgi:hypothetical protein